MKNDTRFDAGLFRTLEAISRNPAMETHVLTEKLGLNLSTARSHVQKLRRARLVISADGRQGVKLDPDYGYVVGIDMGASHLHFALADFSGEIISETVEKVRPEDGPRKTIAQIEKGIRRVAQSKKRRRLLAIALGVPSAVDPRTRSVLFANNLPGWTNIDLRAELQKEFRVPVSVQNDANMAAIGERWCGAARDVDNFVFIALGTGIGSGIFINGQPYEGRTGAAGELQYLNVEWPRWNEDFGDTGYFESHASGQGIAMLGHKLIHPRTRAQSKELAEARDAYFVFEAFHKGNPKAKKALETIFTILGVGIANVVGVLDPEMIVLGGGITKGAPDFMLATIANVAQRLQPNCPPILISTLEDQAQTHGAIYAAMMEACKAAAGQQTKRRNSKRSS